MQNRTRTVARAVAVGTAVVAAGAVLTGVLRSGRSRAPEEAAPPVEAVHPPRALIRAANPVMRWLLSAPGRAGRAADELLLLHVTGRRTGNTYDVPVGYRSDGDGRLVVVTDARWRLNLRDRPDVEVTLRGVRRPAHAELVEDPAAVADVYLARLDARHLAPSARRTGLRLAGERLPSREELTALARREHLSVIRLQVDPPDASSA